MFKYKSYSFFLLLYFFFLNLLSRCFSDNMDESINILIPKKHFSKENATCISCHKEETPSIYQEWGRSKHFNANIGCYECHKSSFDVNGAFRHKDFIISILVTPKKCGECHKEEFEEFNSSYHSRAGEILGSMDNFLANVVEGHPFFKDKSPILVSGCWQCHGSVIKILKNGSLDPSTWPNTGIGRINLDKTRGTCNSCHQYHEFSLLQSRRPESCSKCHSGPSHPQKEIYDQSKHGAKFYSNIKKMNMDSNKWVVGEDYSSAPTCVTCHMAATKDMRVTHDVGSRISWTLRPPVSLKIDRRFITKSKIKSWVDRRRDMKNVCQACHGDSLINNFYDQYDNLIHLYNNKFAIPGEMIMRALLKNNLITNIPFDHKVKWIWFEIWHYEGRKARNGAAMHAPNYTQWHGMYEIAKKFYFYLIPEVREIIRLAKLTGKKNDADIMEFILNNILRKSEHRWYVEDWYVEESKSRIQSKLALKKKYLL